MPNWLAHSIFVDTDTQIVELNGGQVDLFFALIYLTSQSYDHDKSTPKTTTFIYKRSKIQNAIKENKTLNDAMEKLNGLEIITNILESWGDGEPDRFKPFVITPIKAGKRVVKFKIKVEERFIQEFSNPNPKFTLSYEYISAFTNPQAKLLYIILFDHLGKVEENGKPKSRKIDLENLKILMNRSFDCKADKLARDINTSVKLINKHTDIKILKHFNEDDEKDENIKNHKFTMIRTKPYQLYEKNVEDNSEQDGNSITQQSRDDEEAWQETIKKLESRKKNKSLKKVGDEEAWLDKTYNGVVADKKKKQAEQDEAEALQQKTLKLQEQKEAEELEKSKKLIDDMLENEKDKLRDKIDGSKGIPYILFQYAYKGLNDGEMKSCITNEYKLWTEEEGQEGSMSFQDTNKVYEQLKDGIPNTLIPNIFYSEKRIDSLEKMYF